MASWTRSSPAPRPTPIPRAGSSPTSRRALAAEGYERSPRVVDALRIRLQDYRRSSSTEQEGENPRMTLLELRLTEFLDECRHGADTGGRLPGRARDRCGGRAAREGRQGLEGRRGPRHEASRPRRNRCATAPSPLAQIDAASTEPLSARSRRRRRARRARRLRASARRTRRAAEPPLRIAEAAADVAELAVIVAENGEPEPPRGRRQRRGSSLPPRPRRPPSSSP